MKQRFFTLLIGLLLLAPLSIPARAAEKDISAQTTIWCTCGGIMTQSIHRTPWISQEYVDCTHGQPHAKDAYQERLVVTTLVCQRCGEGSTQEVTESRYQCLATRSTMIDPEVAQCTVCLTGEVSLSECHTTPWLTVATAENSPSLQERLNLKSYQCRDCGYGFTQSETEQRQIKLHISTRTF